MSKISNEMYQSLIQKYESDIQRYKTTLMIYFENPVGIGDHKEHLEDMDNLISDMTSAHDKLRMLQLIFNDSYSKL